MYKRLRKERGSLEATELRLARLAQKVIDLYRDDIEPQYYRQLCDAIIVCQEYYISDRGNSEKMYDAVLNLEWSFLTDNNIWNNEKVGNMWGLVRNILTCNSYLGYINDGYNIPQDLKIQEKNILKFVELLECSIGETIDYRIIFNFWHQEMRYGDM